MISDFGKEADPDSVSHGQVRSFTPLDLSGFLKPAPLAPLSCFVFTQRAWLGYPCLPQGGVHRPDWSQLPLAITVREIRGAADKGICRPSGSVHAGRVTAEVGPAAHRP
ncbi:hypothetical protein ATANTOWER_005396 [Ataeniobius toweri]|uniref:Uncharacterized protein n=1 Tax=Ataeniobius toweri TaxID=208326 RepID=A0ABU7B9P2_9TELE|nr:hypothetical protein [Ataeniobius toweri]